MEGGLVDDQAADDGRSVGLVADGQAVEPGRPVRVEVPREPDLVTVRPRGDRVSGVGRSVMPLLVRVASWISGRRSDLSHWQHGGGGCDERASPQVMSDGDDFSEPSRFAERRAERSRRARRSGVEPWRVREQAELGGAADGGPPAVHAELRVDVLRVRAHGRQRHVSSRAMSGPSSSLSSRRRTSSSRSLSGSIRGWSLAAPALRRTRSRPAVGAHGSRRRAASRASLSRARHRRPLIRRRPGRSPPARRGRPRAPSDARPPSRRRGPDARAPGRPGCR